MSNQEFIPASEFCDLVTDGTHDSPKKTEFGVKLVTSKNIVGGKLDLTSAYFISESDAQNINKRSQVHINDVLLSMIGTVGEVALIEKEPDFVIKNVGLLKNSDPKKAKWLYYYLKSPITQNLIKDRLRGTTQQYIPLGELRNLPILKPNSEEHLQNTIEQLSSLDKKIQLNTQINQTLEQIAQAETAKAFPCEMVEVDGVEAPKGWELSTIGDCYDVVMGQSPKGETYNENKQGMLFYQGRAEFGWRFPTPRLFTTDPKRIAEQNSILMSIRAPVGDINIALEKCCIGRGLAALQHKSKSLSFGLYQIQSIKPELDLFNGEGTVFGSINQANLKNIQIINPEEKFIQLFEKNLSSCDSKIMNNEIENNALKEIRDLLLPRLLSGEIQL